MKPDLFPMSLCLILLFLFGVGFNLLADWGQKNRHWHVSLSVVVGVFVTLLVPTLFFLEHLQFALFLLACFGASGLPMVIGSMYRDTPKDHKKARPLGNKNRQMRDAALMKLSQIANAIAEKTERQELSLHDLPAIVNELHQVKGILKSM